MGHKIQSQQLNALHKYDKNAILFNYNYKKFNKRY